MSRGATGPDLAGSRGESSVDLPARLHRVVGFAQVVKMCHLLGVERHAASRSHRISCRKDRAMSADPPIGKPGPFEVKLRHLVAAPRRASTLDIGNSAADLDIDGEPPGPMVEPPRRRYECAHYDTCLDLAAALNWHSFTCRGCSGSVNESLMWRARQKARKDSVAKALCDLPPIVAHRTNSEHAPQLNEDGFTDSTDPLE